jgi:hypothetical protein
MHCNYSAPLPEKKRSGAPGFSKGVIELRRESGVAFR